MPTLTIDGKELTFEGKKLILDVALENGVEIPHYCYHPGLSVVASCRICLAEVASPNPRNDNKVEFLPKLVPTCQTTAMDGMQVYTKSPKAVANQKAVMEYLLINHPLDCPVCDQAGECHLQDYSYQYGRAESRFEEDKAKQPKKDIGPNVYLYSDRCIMCSRCVRFTREVSGTSELMISGRGHTEQIDIFPGKPLDNELSGNVVDICPVGALLDKDFLFTQRVWFLNKTPSIDPVTASGDNIWVEHNEGQIYRVKPRTNMDVNKWWISDEIRYSWKFVHDEARLRHPMRLQQGVQVRCDWKRAYEEVTRRFTDLVRDHGTGCLAVMVSPMLACEEAYLLGRFIRSLDPQATLAVGPIPTQGRDKTFVGGDSGGDSGGGGYTIYAEKCPNSRGVRRALELVNASNRSVFSYDQLLEELGQKGSKLTGLLLTGNYPSAWVTKPLATAVGKKFTVLIDTLPNDLTAKAAVLLPGVTWVEKSGAFENTHGRIQSFQQAIPPIEFGRAEGQIALDLLYTSASTAFERYDPDRVRSQMGGAFATEVHHPQEGDQEQPDMQYVTL